MYVILQVDAIVNSTTTSLQLNSGALSASILKAGGDTLQEECRKVAPKGIKPGKVVVTSGGQLPCQFVVHGAACDWEDEQCKQVQYRKEFTSINNWLNHFIYFNNLLTCRFQNSSGLKRSNV